MKTSDIYWAEKRLFQVGEPVTVHYSIPDIAIDDVEEDGIRIYEPEYIDVYTYIVTGGAWGQGDYRRNANQLPDSDFPEYAIAPVLDYSPPRTSEGYSGTISVNVTPPQFISSFGQSYPVTMRSDATTTGKNINHLIDSYIEPMGHVSHYLMYGPRPKGEVELPKGETYLPGETIVADISAARQLVNDYGKQCSINLYHTGRVHMGGAREADWLVHRLRIEPGQTRYELKPDKAMHNLTRARHKQDTMVGPHLVELWCWGVLVDQTTIHMSLPKGVSFDIAIDEDPSTPPNDWTSPVNKPEAAEGMGPMLGMMVRHPDADVLPKPLAPPPPPTADAEASLAPMPGEPAMPVPFQPTMAPIPEFAPIAAPEPIEIPVYTPAAGGGVDVASLRNYATALRKLAQENDGPGYEGYETQAAQLEQTADQLDKVSQDAPAGGALDGGTPPTEDFGTPPGTVGGLDFGDTHLPGSALIPDASLEDVDVADAPSMWKVAYQIRDIEQRDFAKLNQDYHLSVSLHLRDGDGEWDESGYIPATSNPATSTIATSGHQWLEAGEYEARLYWHGDKHTDMKFILARQQFVVAGDNSGPSVRQADGINLPVYHGDASLSLTRPGNVYPQARREITITANANFSTLDLHYQFRRKSGYSYQCMPYDWKAEANDQALKLYGNWISSDKDIAQHLRKEGDSVDVPLHFPEWPGEYELVLIATAYNMTPKEAEPYMAVREIATMDVTITSPSASIEFVSNFGYGGQGREVKLNLPKDADDNHYKVSAVALEGLLPARTDLDPAKSGYKGHRQNIILLQSDWDSKFFNEMRSTNLSAVVHETWEQGLNIGSNGTSPAELYPHKEFYKLTGGGKFNEVRVLDQHGFMLARKRYVFDETKTEVWADIYDLGMLPPELITVAPSENDWIEDDDPLRALKIWSPTIDQCGELEDPLSDPDIIFVKWVPAEPADIDEETGLPAELLDQGTYEPIKGVNPGYPFFIEAQFEEPEETEAFEVRLGADYKVKLMRLEDDPLVYRSDALTLTGRGIAKGITEVAP